MAITDPSLPRSPRTAPAAPPPRNGGAAAPEKAPVSASAQANNQLPNSLRQETPKTPDGEAGKRALTEQAAVAANGRGTPTPSAQERVAQELKARGLDDDFKRLTPAQQKQFNRLATGLVLPGSGQPPPPGHLTPEQLKDYNRASTADFARNNLLGLLGDGKLTSTDSKGKTLLSNLDSIAHTKFPGLESQDVLKSTLALTNPGKSPYPSTAQAAATANPAELARVTRDLMSQGKAKLANGDTVTKPTAPPQGAVGFGLGGMLDPTRSTVEGALTQYGRDQAKTPEQQAAWQKAVESQLAGDPKALQAYRALTPDQQAQTRTLANLPNADVRYAVADAFGTPAAPQLNANVTKILGEGKLTGKDSQGSTLLANLTRLRPAPEQFDFSRGMVFDQTLQRIAHPEPQQTWTTAQQRQMLTQQPAEYVRVVDGLSGAGRQVKMADGTILTNPPKENRFFLPDPDTMIKEAAVRSAVQSGKPLNMVNTQGETIRAQFSNLGVDAKSGDQRYRVTVDGQSFNLSADSKVNGVADRLGGLANSWSLTPKNMRGELREMRYNSQPNPSDPYWAKEYKMPGFTSLATAGGGRIDVWGGNDLVGESFDHEMGHLIGSRRGTLDSLVDKFNFTDDPHSTPIGWQGVSAQDSKPMSDYGSKSPAEDFAESWAHYMAARRGGDQSLAQFRKDFPQRAATLDRIYVGATW